MKIAHSMLILGLQVMMGTAFADPAANNTWYKAQKTGANYFFGAAGATYDGNNPDAFADTLRTENSDSPGDLSSADNRDEAGYVDASGNDPVALVNASGSYTSANSHYLRFEDFGFTTSSSTNKLYFLVRRTATSGPMYIGFEESVDLIDRPSGTSIKRLAKALATLETVSSTEKATKLYYTVGYDSNPGYTAFNSPETKRDKDVSIPSPTKWLLVEFLMRQQSGPALSVVCNIWHVPGSNAIPWAPTDSGVTLLATADVSIPSSPSNSYLPVVSLDNNDHQRVHAVKVIRP
ncbi:MAG: hypothetical protein U1F77_02115 [Kiritimatiellia bacterium]